MVPCALASAILSCTNICLSLSRFLSYVVTIPSWVNEKKAGVNINRAVWYPATVGLVMKLAVGLMGAWAFRSLGSKENDIVKTMLGDSQPAITQYSAYMWDMTTMIPGIPVLAVMVRYVLLSFHATATEFFSHFKFFSCALQVQPVIRERLRPIWIVFLGRFVPLDCHGIPLRETGCT